MFKGVVGLQKLNSGVWKSLPHIALALLVLSVPAYPVLSARDLVAPPHFDQASWQQPVTGLQKVSKATTLNLNQAIERELAAGEEHHYQVSLRAGQYATIKVEQRGIDLKVLVQGLEGKIVDVIDGGYRKEGNEQVQLLADVAGSYFMTVKSSSKIAPGGSYEIEVTEIRGATTRDRSLHEAAQLEANSRTAFTAGKYEQGRNLAEKALAIYESILGNEHPADARILLILASSYYDDKQEFPKAISLLQRAVAICEKTLGHENPRTIDGNRLLAYLYFETNEVAKAERLAQGALEVSEQTFGPEHLFVARCLNTLAEITGDDKKAERLLRRALAIAEKWLGSDDPFLVILLNEIGVFYLDRGDYERAESYILRAKALREKVLGPENITQVVGLSNLGMLARGKKEYAKAEDYYSRAIAIVEKVFGPDNPRLAIILNNLANIYRARGEYEKSGRPPPRPAHL